MTASSGICLCLTICVPVFTGCEIPTMEAIRDDVGRFYVEFAYSDECYEFTECVPMPFVDELVLSDGPDGEPAVAC